MLLYNLFNSGKLIVGTSMGIDSVSLAWKLNKAFPKRVVLLHVDHNYIPEDSLISFRFFKFVEKFKFQYMILSNGIGHRDDLSPEDLCHRIRQDCYVRALNQLDPFGNIVLAHTLDDACESYLMNCLRGQGEYCPIKPVTPLYSGQIVRPALLETKEQLSRGIPDEVKEFVFEDPLNNYEGSMRNWTRKRLIPVIEEKYTGLRKVVAKKLRLNLAAKKDGLKEA